MTTTTKSRSRGRKTSSAARVDVYQEVTDRVMEALAAGTAPWRKPWNVDHGMPLKLSNREPYRGVNVLLLGMTAAAKGYRSPWWGSYKQIVNLGGKVRSGVGEKSTHVVFFKPFETKEIDPATGKPKTIPFLRSWPVFNVDQADWPAGSRKPVTPDYSARTPGERIEAAEAIAAGYPAGPKVSATGRAAYYKPGPDLVTVPPFEAFASPEEYYSILFHELGHSTGHKDRLNRTGIVEFDHFGSSRYGKEELVAEMTAAMLDGLCGFKLTVDNSAAYLASWLDTIREDRKLVVMAAAAAQKAADHIMGVTWSPDAGTEAAPDSEED